MSVYTKVVWQLNVWHTRAHRMLLLTPIDEPTERVLGQTWTCSCLASAMSCRFYLNGLSLLHGVVIVPLDGWVLVRQPQDPKTWALWMSSRETIIIQRRTLYYPFGWLCSLAFAGWAWNAFGDSDEDCQLDWACAEPLSCRHCNLYCQPPAVCLSLSADLRRCLRLRLSSWLSLFVTWFLLVFSV